MLYIRLNFRMILIVYIIICCRSRPHILSASNLLLTFLISRKLLFFFPCICLLSTAQSLSSFSFCLSLSSLYSRSPSLHLPISINSSLVFFPCLSRYLLSTAILSSLVLSLPQPWSSLYLSLLSYSFSASASVFSLPPPLSLSPFPVFFLCLFV